MFFLLRLTFISRWLKIAIFLKIGKNRGRDFPERQFRTYSGAKSNFVPNDIPIGFEMAEKNVNRQTYIFVFIQVEIKSVNRTYLFYFSFIFFNDLKFEVILLRLKLYTAKLQFNILTKSVCFSEVNKKNRFQYIE